MTHKLATEREVQDKHGIEKAWVNLSALRSNPENWRIHGPLQIRALGDLIYGDQRSDGKPDGATQVGWVRPIIINRREEEWGWEGDEAIPTVIDGHARIEMMEARAGEDDPAALCLLGSWTPAQETLLLATLDPVGGLATADDAAVHQLLLKMSNESDAVRDIVGLARTRVPKPEKKRTRLGEAGDEVSATTAEILTVGRIAVPLSHEEQEILSAMMRCYVDSLGIAFGFLGSVFRGEQYVSA